MMNATLAMAAVVVGRGECGSCMAEQCTAGLRGWQSGRDRGPRALPNPAPALRLAYLVRRTVRWRHRGYVPAHDGRKAPGRDGDALRRARAFRLRDRGGLLPADRPCPPALRG